jgi:hypothetical protein
MQRLRRAVNTLSLGGDNSNPDEPLRILACPTRYRTYLRSLPELFARARRDGLAFGRPAPSILIEIGDAHAIERRTVSSLNRMRARAAERAGIDLEGTDTMKFSTIHRRIRDRRGPTPGLAPVAIFPIDEEDVLAILMGGLVLTTHLCAARLEEEFAARHIDVHVVRRHESEVGEVFLHARRGTHTVAVPAFARDQVFLELMTTASLISQVAWLLALPPGRGVERMGRASNAR